MLIPTENIRDWKDLQDKVADLFREMGYEVHSPHVVQHVRGSKEVDVYVRDPRTSVPHVILIECSKREKVRTIFGKRLKTCRLGRAFWCVHPYGQFRRVCSRSGFPEAPICEKEPTL